MSNLQIFDPHYARKLERKQNNKYYLWTFTHFLSNFYIADTIEQTRVLWIEAKASGKWQSWELSRGRELIKKGKF